MLLNAVRGFCMALADSVPGVSGGTIAFLLGFYDEFINSLNDMIGKDNTKRKAALIFLIKLGIGWVDRLWCFCYGPFFSVSGTHL